MWGVQLLWLLKNVVVSLCTLHTLLMMLNRSRGLEYRLHAMYHLKLLIHSLHSACHCRSISFIVSLRAYLWFLYHIKYISNRVKKLGPLISLCGIASCNQSVNILWQSPAEVSGVYIPLYASKLTIHDHIAKFVWSYKNKLKDKHLWQL